MQSPGLSSVFVSAEFWDRTGFKSAGQAQRFLSVHGVVGNLFRVGRQKVRAGHYRLLRNRSFEAWQEMTCAC